MKLRPLAPKLGLPYMPPGVPGGMGVIVDYFAGGGGASTGIEQAMGRAITLAVNHNPKAVAMHERNHPHTEHACEDVYRFPIRKWLGMRLWDIWWLSPDCTHHSRAKGGKPLSNKRRSLANVACEVVEALPAWQRPRLIGLENVSEWLKWGPLLPNDRPDPDREGEDFRAWVARLEAAGYVVEWREKRVCANYGDPTTRTRLVLMARCDGLPIVWPEGEYADPKLKPSERRGKMLWRTAGTHVIDFSIAGKSIFGRKKPLAEATLMRIARGIQKFVIDREPFLVPLTHHKPRRNHPMDEPLPTITCANGGELAHIEPRLAAAHAHVTRNSEQPAYALDRPTTTVVADGAHHNLVESLLAPCLVHTAHADVGKNGSRRWGHGERAADVPMNTVTRSQDMAVVEAAFVSGVTQSSTPRVFDADAPIPTITTAKGGELTLVTTHMLRLQGNDRRDGSADEPLGAVCAGGEHHAQVAAFMAQHNIDRGGRPKAGRSLDEPVSTVTVSGAQQGLVELDLTPAEIEEGCERVLAFMLKYYGNETSGVAADEPMDTVTTKDRFALITVHIKGVPYRIYDIRMRMLTPRELFNAQGFPQSYIIRPFVTTVPKPRKSDIRSGRVRVIAKRMSKADSIAMCGNSVPPGLARAHIAANAPPMSRLEGPDRWRHAA